MRSVLCDINFFLDIFLKREPFYIPAAGLFQRIENASVKGFICALSFPILFYILSRELSREKALKILKKIRIVFSVSDVDEKNIDLSLTSDFRDIEDAIQYYSAVNTRVDYIITRNKKDYIDDKIPVLSPDEFLAIEFP